MAQMNPTVGDLTKNSEMILRFVEEARAASANIVVFPELALTGYPPEDLLLKPGFIGDNIRVLNDLAGNIRDITAVIGFVDRKSEIYNAAAIIHNGSVAGVYHKMFLPNYGVFDEERYFQAGDAPLNIKLDDITIGIGICEDIWYPEGPASVQALAGAEVIISINASPYQMGKALLREETLVTRAVDNDVIIAYNNIVGGQDELVFDGHGLIVSERGKVIVRGKSFVEELIVADLDLDGPLRSRRHDPRRRKVSLKADTAHVRELKLYTTKVPSAVRSELPLRSDAPPERLEEVLQALIMGTRDYVLKNGFKHVVIALSGGIDSALVLAIATEALGAENITTVFMPSKYSSHDSKADAEALARTLDVELLNIPIEELVGHYADSLSAYFKDTEENVAEENLQARIRGNLIMALSNKFGWLVLTTGNKSEMSVGYATLYGDMAGGFAIIKDVPKTLVYELSKYINKRSSNTVIPDRIITRPPSAELRADQTDQDTLPPYDVLDQVLRAYVEEDMSIDDISELGYDRDLVKRIVYMVDLSEYKRRQAPPGIKITERAFGKDRRMPITNGYENPVK